jgi:hypothetical protein
MPPVPFSDEDRAQLEARGVSLAEAERQLAILSSPPPAVRLDRPCTPGDGIERLDAARAEALGARADAAAAAGRVLAFVPASGAATRMFQDLLACRAAGDPLDRAGVEARAAGGSAEARGLLGFVEGLDRFAFTPALARALAVRGADLAALAPAGPWRPVLDALLDDEGLGYARLPKGLVEFHADDAGPRSAFDEHLIDGARAFRAAGGTVRLHVTVPGEHLERFRESLARAEAHWGPRLDARFAVAFSEQSPATDTLAAGPDGAPFRDAHGGLLFRPAGHGALLGNLAGCGADLVFLRNVDNVAAEPWKRPAHDGARALVGLLDELCAAAAAALDGIERDPGPAAVEAAVAFLASAFREHPPRDADAPARRAWAAATLDRPTRVCGMVANTGEPGGGPFWVREPGGAVTRQIVESAQVDPDDPDQREVFRRGTHFNPVFMAVALRDRRGRPYDLARFVDPDAVIVTRKSSGGRALLALERPGLWNGAMARWNTRFVEVPIGVFNPVKTVLDLLRREHQPAPPRN